MYILNIKPNLILPNLTKINKCGYSLLSLSQLLTQSSHPSCRLQIKDVECFEKVFCLSKSKSLLNFNSMTILKLLPSNVYESLFCEGGASVDMLRISCINGKRINSKCNKETYPVNRRLTRRNCSAGLCLSGPWIWLQYSRNSCI